MTASEAVSPPKQAKRWLQQFETVLDKRWTTVAFLIVGADALLCVTIIRHIRYTEIDWTTYMEQVALVREGERNYSKIKGPTGFLVYPAGHVYVYGLLHAMTDEGRNVRLVQYMFAGFYTISLGLVMAIYRKCRTIPPIILLFLPLSKRLHSIYVLRLFNDGLAMTVMYGCILACMNRRWRLSAVLYSFALSIKMNILLFLPAFLLLSYLDTGFNKTFRHLSIVLITQVILGLPFLLENPTAYLKGAFDFSRDFQFQWTVNWRFLGATSFHSRILSFVLLLAHISLLLIFLKKWLRPHGGFRKVTRRSLTGLNYPGALSRNALTADYFTHVFFTSNLIGILCARSLHYQFYSWYALQTAFVVWRSPFPLLLKLALLLGIEVCWNIYPSTNLSSSALFAFHAILLVGCYLTRTTELQARKLGPNL